MDMKSFTVLIGLFILPAILGNAQNLLEIPVLIIALHNLLNAIF